MIKKVLIVEDELIIQIVNIQVIEEAGYEVCAAVTNGEDAIIAVRKFNPDLILMDIKLEGVIDGIDAMQQIRLFSKVPVIYITGNSDSYHLKRAKETGMNDFLIKPVEFEVMIKAINKVFA